MENLVTRGKTPRGRVDNQQTQQTLRVEYGTRTQAKLVKDESLVLKLTLYWRTLIDHVGPAKSNLIS